MSTFVVASDTIMKLSWGWEILEILGEEKHGKTSVEPMHQNTKRIYVILKLKYSEMQHNATQY